MAKTFWISEEDGAVLRRIAEIDDGRAASLVSIIQEEAATSNEEASAGPRAEAVTVVAIDEAKFLPHRAPHGPAQHVEEWQAFPSALALSRALGYKHNAVALELGKDFREQNARIQAEWDEQARSQEPSSVGVKHTLRIRPTGTLRGVTFQYTKDVREC